MARWAVAPVRAVGVLLMTSRLPFDSLYWMWRSSPAFLTAKSEELLLERGADPSRRTHVSVMTPLMVAAKAGSMGILRKLVDAGAKLYGEDRSTVILAIKKEHTAMVELLLSWGVGTSTQGGPFLYRDAEGLDSMADLLKSSGIDFRWISDA